MLFHSLLLFLAAVIWGTAFVAQSVGAEYIGGFTLTGLRFLIGSFVLVPVILISSGIRSRSENAEKERSDQTSAGRITLLRGGLVCGLVLCTASNLQQLGIPHTTVGKAGFITACYIILVPIFGLFLKKTCSPLVWLAVMLAVIGLYLLCIKESFRLEQGDTLVLISSVFYALHILTIDHYAPLTDPIKLSCLQFFVTGIVSCIPALIFEHPDWNAVYAARLPVLYTGVLSSGAAYTLQIIGQNGMNPTVASLIMSLESSISVISGWLFLGQEMSERELLGCLFMFAAIVIAQLPAPSRVIRNRRNNTGQC